jgi:hypothetical protein
MIKKKAYKAKKGNWSNPRKRDNLYTRGETAEQKKIKALEEKLYKLKHPFGPPKPTVKW